MLLEYAGPGPISDGLGGLLRPGEVVEWDGEPAWGPWKPVPEDDERTEHYRAMSTADPGPHDAALSAPETPPAGGGDPDTPGTPGGDATGQHGDGTEGN